ncbi:MAG: hypothetical protein JXR95_04330 [Deltaproteobacteria bacterium]|nr:hypothetical protein [Deltaproteobacteria bacterium]
MVLLVYKSTLESEVMEYLADATIRYFTKWQQVQGQGSSSNPHMDNHVWPGTNHVLAVMCEKPEKEIIFKIVKTIREKVPGQGIKAFSLPVLDHT